MKQKFFAWFEAKEDEPAVSVVLKNETTGGSKTLKVSRNKLIFVAAPAVLAAGAVAAYFFTIFAIALTVVLALSAILYVGTIVYDTFVGQSKKKTPEASDDGPEPTTHTATAQTAEKAKEDPLHRGDSAESFA